MNKETIKSKTMRMHDLSVLFKKTFNKTPSEYFGVKEWNNLYNSTDPKKLYEILADIMDTMHGRYIYELSTILNIKYELISLVK